MNKSVVLTLGLLLAFSSTLSAQRNQRGPRPGQQRGPMQNGDQRGQQGRSGAMDVPENTQAIGAAGIAWYTTWETGLAEAKRSNRPIFFMSAATACSGVSGVF